MNKIFITLLILLPFISYSQNQKKPTKPLPITVMTGDLKPLRSETDINIEFAYDSMIIGKDTPEKEFIAQRIKNWNEKEQGKGEEWERYWYANRKQYYESAFRNSFYSSSHLGQDDHKAKYTLILKTKHTEIGWNTGMVHRAASVNAEAWIVESADHSKLLVKIQLFDIRGKNANGGDFEMGLRIVEAYEKAGEVLGNFIN